MCFYGAYLWVWQREDNDARGAIAHRGRKWAKDLHNNRRYEWHTVSQLSGLWDHSNEKWSEKLSFGKVTLTRYALHSLNSQMVGAGIGKGQQVLLWFTRLEHKQLIKWLSENFLSSCESEWVLASAVRNTWPSRMSYPPHSHSWGISESHVSLATDLCNFVVSCPCPSFASVHNNSRPLIVSQQLSCSFIVQAL